MGRRTPLYDLHVAAGARMVDFGGWDMPVGYGSQIEEHHAVRRDAGMFDVSHMCVVDLRGAGVRPLLLRLLANDVGRLTAPGKALYSCMLRPDGGVIDDLIACYLGEKWFRVVVNAGTADKDLAWIKEHAKQIGVALEGLRDFVGKAALEKQLAAGVARRQTGLLLEDRGVLRAHQKVFAGAAGEGEVTSGTFSPTLERSIALARLPAAAAGRVEVDIRGKRVPARIVKPPFARNGKARIES
jgi:glycine cleavage system aminomethyltransferase T